MLAMQDACHGAMHVVVVAQAVCAADRVSWLLAKAP